MLARTLMSLIPSQPFSPLTSGSPDSTLWVRTDGGGGMKNASQVSEVGLAVAYGLGALVVAAVAAGTLHLQPWASAPIVALVLLAVAGALRGLRAVSPSAAITQQDLTEIRENHQ